MPIDPSVVGKEMAPMEYSYLPRDVMLYALGVGATAEADDLKFVYENGLQVLPTFGVIPPFPALMGIITVEGVQINPVMILHGEQYLEIRKPIPIEGKLITKPRVGNLYDKGKGALIELDAETIDESGDVVFFNKFGVFVRGEGGFGGEKGPDPGNEAPDRAPDKVVEYATLPQQAAIYRLSGDYNPLHIDPNISGLVGYEKPILHGLCSFGFVGRAILKEFAGNDPSKFKSIKVRFSRHVFPGETIVTEMWKEADDRIVFQAKTKERGETCLSNCCVMLNV